MAVHTVTEAAKLAGVTRRTIYRYIKQGKLSTVVTGSESTQIDTSELLRVFGSLSQQEAPKVSTGSQVEEPEYVTRLMAEMSQIRDLVQGQQQLLLEDKIETQKLREQVTGLQNERDSVAQELDKVKAELEAERGKGFWKRLFRQG
ncbi:TPA: helix-turn-helix domain-containing protein [Klebsiella pneumoniae]|uniref:helix-turn-helix domain-containing protein n=1 Tax=Enterobacteriaceae TaxID=543 RepID=UPI000C9A961D|nr:MULTISPECIES: helix-turn-helix domain-containing protein [Enterobacteriaceae]MBP3138924.1 helix-turn-helix domain-containing protein [Klebsiella pneumoniae]MCL7665729.1 helix-turn-helix domain-containing protein [Klebsiella pneumoniae]HCA4642680.1 helix-turn-helix domain-containing protein [Klebsiella pneumoniae]HEE5143922.1 helix-turn-helix domain-containing protein [Klebsiella pneumoniae]